MKFAKFILPYVLISPVSVAVFFITLFVSCLSIEFVMNGMLHALGAFSLVIADFPQHFRICSRLRHFPDCCRIVYE